MLFFYRVLFFSHWPKQQPASPHTRSRACNGTPLLALTHHGTSISSTTAEYCSKMVQILRCTPPSVSFSGVKKESYTKKSRGSDKKSLLTWAEDLRKPLAGLSGLVSTGEGSNPEAARTRATESIQLRCNGDGRKEPPPKESSFILGKLSIRNRYPQTNTTCVNRRPPFLDGI